MTDHVFVCLWPYLRPLDVAKCGDVENHSVHVVRVASHLHQRLKGEQTKQMTNAIVSNLLHFPFVINIKIKITNDLCINFFILTMTNIILVINVIIIVLIIEVAK